MGKKLEIDCPAVRRRIAKVGNVFHAKGLPMFERSVVTARVSRHGHVSRRQFLRTIGWGTAGLAGLGWHDLLLAAQPALRKQGKSVIVLWMAGGPSQFDTFDPKPGVPNGGTVKAIATSVPGIEIAHHWPNVAKQMNDIALIRSMTNKEGNHQRATYQLHTGYAPSGTVKHPSFGSLVTNEIAPPDFDLPGFVSILGPSAGPGFLPVSYAPFRVASPTQLPANTQATVPTNRYDRRLGLLGKLEETYGKAGAERQVRDHQDLYSQASRLVKSPKLQAFDISKEETRMREQYGSSAFGQGCLLARRLVEAGVTYIEVQLGGWDMHDGLDDRMSRLAGPCDQAFAALIGDLKDRGLLDSTLVVWMGEFGRTPKINPRAGRDHFPRCFTAAVAGGGIQGGMVIGKSSDDGESVVDRPVTPNDLFATLCDRLNINPKKENISPLGRPMKIVDGGEPIRELLG